MNNENDFQLEELDFRSILEDLLRNVWMIVLGAVTCALLATSVLKLTYKPQYSSSATLAIMTKGSNSSTYTSLTTASDMAKILANVFDIKALRSKVAEDLNLTEFNCQVTADVISETNLLLVTVASSDPREAYLGLNSILNNYRDVSDYIFNNAVTELLSSPRVPMEPSNPLEIGKYQRLAFLGGGVLFAVIIIVMSAFRNTVKGKRMATRRLEGTYLGSIPHEEKNRTLKSRIRHFNKGLLITNPICSFSFAESIQKLTVRVEYHLRKNNQKLLMISSTVENEGKTTVAANIALSLAAKGYRVLVLDLDLRKPAVYKLFELDESKYVNLRKLVEEGTAIDSLFYDDRYHLYFIPNKVSYDNSQDFITSNALKEFLNECRKRMDYVIIDTPPWQVSSDAEIVASIADASIAVVRRDWADIRDINEEIDTLNQEAGEFLGYILNDVYENKTLKSAREYSYSNTAHHTGE